MCSEHQKRNLAQDFDEKFGFARKNRNVLGKREYDMIIYKV